MVKGEALAALARLDSELDQFVREALPTGRGEPVAGPPLDQLPGGKTSTTSRAALFEIRHGAFRRASVTPDLVTGDDVET